MPRTGGSPDSHAFTWEMGFFPTLKNASFLFLGVVTWAEIKQGGGKLTGMSSYQSVSRENRGSKINCTSGGKNMICFAHPTQLIYGVSHCWYHSGRCVCKTVSKHIPMLRESNNVDLRTIQDFHILLQPAYILPMNCHCFRLEDIAIMSESAWISEIFPFNIESSVYTLSQRI